MFKIERDVPANEPKAKLTAAFETEGVTITRTDLETGEVTEIKLQHDEADALYDCLFLAHPAYKRTHR